MIARLTDMLNYEGWGWFLLDIVMLLTSIVMIYVIIRENKDPIRTIAWILVLVLIPVGGIILYLYLGQNPRKRKMINKKTTSDSLTMDGMAMEQLDLLNAHQFIRNERLTRMRSMMRLLLNNNKALITRFNRIKILNNGRQTFGSIIYELENARHHIHFEFYIIEDDVIGNRIKDILVRKALAGVEVRVVFDDLGSWSLSKKKISDLKKAGAEVYSFMPVRTYVFANKVNFRLHRKIIVVDGKYAFVGGINIADRYLRGLDKDNNWRDTHLKLEGEAVKSLQAVFIMDWSFVSGHDLKGLEYFPDHQITEERMVQVVTSGPDSDWESIMQAYFHAIATSQRYVYISTPYFLPNESVMTALKTAALSGVDVRILLPEKNDSWIVGKSSRSYLMDLLLAGVRVYFYLKGFTHSKLMIVDDIFASVGTANMDIRSFNQDFEVNALIYNEELAIRLRDDFMMDIANSLELDVEQWKRRPRFEKTQESIARIFSPLL